MSGWNDRPIGTLDTYPPSELGARCADRVMAFAGPRAVTVDPEGRVWVEPVREAAEDDLVGVYSRSLGVLALSKWIAEDLREVVQARRERPARRVVVNKRRAAA